MLLPSEEEFQMLSCDFLEFRSWVVTDEGSRPRGPGPFPEHFSLRFNPIESNTEEASRVEATEW
jgi:hypothetical protein